MGQSERNYYGSLCAELYEILHEKPPQDELDFYLSYARRGEKIWEPLCGNGRFLIPFLQRGMDIQGMDLSAPMLQKLKQKAPGAKAICADLTEYCPRETFHYILIPSGSVSLFTDQEGLRKALRNIKQTLAPGGKFVFSVEAEAGRRPDDAGWRMAAAVQTKEGFDLTLREKSRYDRQSRIQFLPGVYELRRGGRLIQREEMDFQIRLYRLGEMEKILGEIGFGPIQTYSSFGKETAVGGECEMFLFECGAGR